MRTREAAPRASVLLESMRDIGYSLGTALADIIDNAITAGARNIRLFSEEDAAGARICTIDDGSGMDEDELVEAMRPGSKSPLDRRNKSDLGRFGLGLKTASFSQSRRVTVVSRAMGITCAAIWDLDFVAKVDAWRVQLPDDTSDIPFADNMGASGTLVLWEKLDRIGARSGTATHSGQFVQKLDEARLHLELVFHRFLTAEPGFRKIHISLNSRELESFDPFATRFSATIVGPVETIKVGKHEVRVQPFTLPHHRKIKTSDWEHNAGPEGYLKNQGFYVYRGRRLIIHGTWFGLARQQELTKLARVRIDMPNALDSDWHIDIRKASAHPPAQVRERLRRIVEGIGNTSKRVYTRRGVRLVSENPSPVWNRLQDKNQISYRINRDHPLIDDLLEQMDETSKASLGHVIELLEASMPYDALFSDFGEGSENMAEAPTSDETLLHTVITTVNRLKEKGVQPKDVADMLKAGEPFRSNWTRTATILEQLD